MEWHPISQLSIEDLKSSPVWEWRESEYSEEARPTALDSIPEADGNLVYIALTKFTLLNGEELYGYCSPGDDSGLDYIQPVIILEDCQWNIYEGPLPSQMRERNIFPIAFECLVPCNGKFLKQLISRTHNKGVERNR